MSVLQEQRKKHGLTQSQLAKMIHHKDGSEISLQTVSNWENIKRVPDPYEMKQAAEILNCPVDELFYEFFYNKEK